MKKLYFLFVFLAFISCKSQEDGGDIATIDFLNSHLIDENIEDWIQVEYTIQLEIPDSIPFGKVMQIEFTDTEILVLENGINSSVLIFDREGVFKRQLLEWGNGPGEYLKIDFFVLKDSSILVYDRSTQKLMTYSFADLSLMQEFKTTDYFMGGLGRLENDRVFLISDSKFDEGFYKGYEFLNSDLSEFLLKPQFAGYVEGFIPEQISYIKDQPYLVQAFTDKVFQITSDSLVLAYEFDFGSKKIPKEAIEIEDAEEFYGILENGAYHFAAHNLLFRKSSIAFNFFNETIENINFGLIDGDQTYRFVIDSDVKELFLKPICVRETMFQTILLPGEYDQEIGAILNLTEINYEKPILVSYHIGK